MTVSLITTCFNRANTIERTIQSVLSQDHNNVEYIVIDGASTDGSAEIIERYSDRITHFVSEPDNGMYEAINKGIRLASGDIIGLIHSDDEFYSQTILSKIDAAFEQSGADIVYGNGIFVDMNNPRKIIRNWISGKYKRTKVKQGWLPLHPTVYAKREVFEQCRLYDESYKIAADSDMLVRMLYNHHFKVYYLNEYIVRMSMGGISTSFKSQIYKWKEDLRMYRSHNFNPYWTLGGKILSKIPQFLKINV
ncbi:MAG: glycosyltransferase [Prevotellaceae bacterium]|jgi:glycosyltransferase|nr:glycosyltransferase [Prevotellaceae bacterium]